MKQQFACVALDLDGTTLRSDGSLSPAVRDSLLKLLDQNIPVVVASGRPYGALPKSVTELPGVAYAVCSNGATVWHLPTDTCIHRTVLPAGAAEAILEAMAGEKVRFECFRAGKPYADRGYIEDPVGCGALPSAIPYLRATRIPLDDIEGFIRAHADDLESMDVVVGDQSVKAELYDRLVGLRDDLYVTGSEYQLLEVAHRDAGKQRGLAVVLERLGLTPAQTVAFGDANNDIEMLAWAGLGVAMENGSDRAKAAADRIAPSNDADGVAVLLNELFFA